MSGGPIEPLDRELESLLHAERDAAAPKEALDRVWTRVAGFVPPMGPSGGGSGAGGATTGGWLASHAGAVAAVTFAVGAATGAGAVSVLKQPAPERIVYVDLPSPSTLRTEVAPPPSATPTAPSAIADSPPSARPVPPAASSLSLERGVLADARAALASGDAARALRLSDEHLRRFPRAQLGEEREAIAIQALVGLGRYEEARARAARFRASSPHSLLLPAIDAALASIP